MDEVENIEQEVGRVGKEEVRKTLMRIESGKAVGPDDILVEVWKYLGESSRRFDQVFQNNLGQ